MTPDAYARLLADLGFESTRHVADFFRVAHSSAQKWAKDGPTPPVEKMLCVMNVLGWGPDYVDKVINAPREDR